MVAEFRFGMVLLYVSNKTHTHTRREREGESQRARERESERGRPVSVCMGLCPCHAARFESTWRRGQAFLSCSLLPVVK
jgi:hypothetical protein